MFPEEIAGALERNHNLATWVSPASVPVVMNDLGAGVKNDLPPAKNSPVTEIAVFEVADDVLVEKADLAQSLASG